MGLSFEGFHWPGVATDSTLAVLLISLVQATVVSWLGAGAPAQGWSQWSPKPVGHGSKMMVPFGIGAPPTLVYFSGDRDVHSGVRGFDPRPVDCGWYNPKVQKKQAELLK